MSVRKRGSRFVAAIYDPATQRKRHVGTFDSRKEAKHAEAQAMLDRKRRPDPVTVEAFAARWTAPGGSYAREKESTNIHNAEAVRKFRRDFGGRPLTSITRVEAREWAHANRWRHKAVRAMFSDAVRDELLDHNPFVGLRFKEARGRRDLIVPTEAEVAELAEIAGRVHGAWGERVYAHLITTAAYTGLRPGELYGLEWRDVDWDREQVRVERQFNQATRTLTPPKNGLRRTIYMLPQAREALEQVQRTSRDWVFCGPTGVRFSGRIQSGYWGPVGTSRGTLSGTSTLCDTPSAPTSRTSVSARMRSLRRSVIVTAGSSRWTGTSIRARRIRWRGSSARSAGRI